MSETLKALIDKEIALTKEDLAYAEKQIAILNNLMQWAPASKVTPPADALSCNCSFSIGGKKHSFSVYGAKDPKLFALYNPELVKAYELFLQENKAIELKKRLREYVSSAIRTNTNYYEVREYGIDVVAISKHLGPRPSPDHQIDHIIPLAAFDFNNPEQIMQAFAPENHQWLPRLKNSKKSDYWHHNGKRIKGREWV